MQRPTERAVQEGEMTDWYEDEQGVSRPVMHRLVIRDEQLLREALEALKEIDEELIPTAIGTNALSMMARRWRVTITKLEERLK